MLQKHLIISLSYIYFLHEYFTKNYIFPILSVMIYLHRAKGGFRLDFLLREVRPCQFLKQCI